MPEVRRTIQTAGPVDAVVTVPGSKSIANRALVCAALASGTTTLTNVPDGDDTAMMLASLRTLGIDTEFDAGRAAVPGLDGTPPEGNYSLFAGLAGTTSRFLTALAALGGGNITIDGAPPLRSRPFQPLHDALTQLGVLVDTPEGAGTLPATISGPPTAGQVSIRGDVSSQFITALMLIGPYLPAGLTLTLTTPLISRPYVELTASVMGWFGVDRVLVDGDSVVVPAGRYTGCNLDIEPDASSASYPLALAAVVGGSIEVPGLGVDALQGDARFGDLMAEMGCDVERSTEGTIVRRGADVPLNGIDVDMADISDLVPTVATVACFAASSTRIRGVGFIRGKESDRIGDLATELRRAGADVREMSDGLEIIPGAAPLHGARLGTHHDHRLAMAFGVLGSAVAGIEIEDPGVVSKSWQGYWDMLDRLHSEQPG